MSRRVLLFALGAALIFGCKKETTPPVTVSSQTQTTQTTQTTAVTTTTAQAPAPVPTSQPATPAPQPAGAVIASQETNWKGVVADVTEFRRKGNTLTAKVRLTYRPTDGEGKVIIVYDEVYLIDTAGGKKYQVLKDEKGAFIAALRQGYTDKWYEYLKPGDSQVIWMKFPAPPAEVKAITLQLPSVPPFEDLKIQD